MGPADALALAARPFAPLKEVGDQRAFLASGPPTVSMDLCWRGEGVGPMSWLSGVREQERKEGADLHHIDIEGGVGLVLGGEGGLGVFHGEEGRLGDEGDG